MKVTCFITCNSCVSLFLSNGMKTLFWLQVPTGRCSSLWRILIAPCQARQGVVVLCWHKSQPPFPHLELPRQDVVVLCWRCFLVSVDMASLLRMEFEESVSVQLTLNRNQMTWNRVLLPCPWKLMNDQVCVGHMKSGSLQ